MFEQDVSLKGVTIFCPILRYDFIRKIKTQLHSGKFYIEKSIKSIASTGSDSLTRRLTLSSSIKFYARL